MVCDTPSWGGDAAGRSPSQEGIYFKILDYTQCYSAASIWEEIVLVLLPLATLLARRAVVFFCGHYARKTHLNESEYTRRNFCPRTASILARHAVAPDQQACVVDTPRSLQTVPQVCPVTCTHALSHSVLHSTRAVNIVFSRTSSRRVGNSRPKTQHGTTAQGLCRASAQLTMNSVAWSGCMPTSNDAPRSVATCVWHV